MVDWKFSALDKDNDNKLKRTEIRQLKKMTKKLVKPKSCARTLEEYCDRDKDKKISRKEWSICLGVDMNSEYLDSSDTMRVSSDTSPGRPPLISGGKCSATTRHETHSLISQSILE